MAVLTILLGARLLWLTDLYAVNLLFGDQWDFYTPLFRGLGVWEAFGWQHVTHRQGFCFLVMEACAHISGWNSRVDAFANVVIVCLSAGAALVLKRRILGPVRWYDSAIPLMFLTPLQWEIFLIAPNPSVGSFPQLLLILYCMAWLISDRSLRYAGVLLLNFLSVFSGYGFFVGVITSVLLVADVVVSLRDGPRRHAFAAIMALGVCMLTNAVFLAGHVFVAGAVPPCFRFPDPRPWLYPLYMALTHSGLFGLRDLPRWVAVVPGGVFLGCAVMVLLFRIRRLIGKPSSDRGLDLVVAILIGFSLMYCTTLAVGRLCFGLDLARGSRYVTYLVPCALGVYLHLIATRSRRTANFLLALLMVGLVWGALPLGKADMAVIEEHNTGQRRWKEVFLNTGSIETADRVAGYRLHPDPERTGLQEKLEYLRKHRLNLYLDSGGN